MRFSTIAAAFAVALVIAPIGLGHSVLPLNSIQNASFESGWAGWLTGATGFGAMAVVSGGSQGSANALYTGNSYIGAFAHQYIATVAPLGTTILFDFDAKIVSGLNNPGLNTAEAIGQWNPIGTGQITARVGFLGGEVSLDVWTAAPTDSNTVAAPTDGGWHHYQVVMVGAAGVGVLLIDGMPAIVATGDPASVGQPDRIIVGDVAYCDCSLGPAPSVQYDEFYYGPQV